MTKTLLVAMLLGFGLMGAVMCLAKVWCAICDWVFCADAPKWRAYLFFSAALSAFLFLGMTHGR